MSWYHDPSMGGCWDIVGVVWARLESDENAVLQMHLQWLGKAHKFQIDFEKIAEQAEHLKSLAYLLLSTLRCLALKQVQGT